MFIKYLAAFVFITCLFTVASFGQTLSGTFVVRTGVSDTGVTYSLTEGYVERGKLLLIDVGVVTFGNFKDKDYFVGAGGTVYSSKFGYVVLEGYVYREHGGGLYVQPFVVAGGTLGKKWLWQAAGLVYVPVNRKATVQFLLERAKIEYDFKHFRLGVGYAGYQFGASGTWASKPFVTASIRVGIAGVFEGWVQRVPGSLQLQIRYVVTIK